MIETIGKGVKKIALVQINNDKILDLCRRAAEELNIEINNVVSDLKLTNEGKTETFDLCILILEGTNPRIHSLQYHLSKKIESKKILIFNENFTKVSAPKNWIIASIEKFSNVLLPRLFTSPKTFFVDFFNALKRLLKLKK